MLLQYTGKGEPVPELAGEFVAKDAVRLIKDESVAKKLLKTKRWVKLPLRKPVPKPEAVKPPEQPTKGVDDGK